MCSNDLALPSSYASLRFQQIRLSHVPPSSPIPTKVILVTLHRPGKYNAFTDAMADELAHAFALFDLDDRVKAIVVTGDGKMFCAGADLEVGLNVGDEAVRDHRDGCVAPKLRDDPRMHRIIVILF